MTVERQVTHGLSESPNCSVQKVLAELGGAPRRCPVGTTPPSSGEADWTLSRKRLITTGTSMPRATSSMTAPPSATPTTRTPASCGSSPGTIEGYVARLHPFDNVFQPGHRPVVELSNDEPLADEHNALLPPDAFPSVHQSQLVLPLTKAWTEEDHSDGLMHRCCPKATRRSWRRQVRRDPSGRTAVAACRLLPTGRTSSLGVPTSVPVTLARGQLRVPAWSGTYVVCSRGGRS